jgi:DNA-binding SARP family transcriptional activator
MQGLRVKMFGSLQIVRSADVGHPDPCDEYVQEPCSRRAQALLAYLLLHRSRMHRREVLAGVLWGEASEERARGALRTTLWRLRRAIEPAGVPTGRYLVTTSQGEVGVRVGIDVWVDVAAFEEAVAKAVAGRPEALQEEHAAQLELSLRLYEGELLEGFYDDWVLRERERLRALYLQALACLMHSAAKRADLKAAIDHGRRLLVEDPLRESVHREVMRLYLRDGQRAEALRQFAECRRILDEELQVEPMAETLAVYRQVVGSTAPASAARGIPRSRLLETMDNLKKAFVELRRAQDELNGAIQEMAALTDASDNS